MRVTIDVSYKIGTVIEGVGRIYTVIGYEYIESRGSRVCLAYIDNGTVQWLWVFPTELALIEQNPIPSLTPLSHDPSIRSRKHPRKRR